MEGDGLRAEGEFLVLFVFCREQLENRVLGTALDSLCSTRENYEGRGPILTNVVVLKLHLMD